MNQYYPHLFQPLRVNTMMLKNRIIASTMGIPKSHELLSTTHYGNVSIIDKSVGGAAMTLYQLNLRLMTMVNFQNMIAMVFVNLFQ
ncbi:MAG: hypothetical protein ACLRQF_05705 [Thomasclavelia ramosa]